jgi:putative ABC transport system permease protein
MGSNLITVRPGASVQGGVRMDPSSMQTLVMKDYISLNEKVSSINKVSPLVTGSGQLIQGANNWPSTLYGVSPEYLDIRILKVEKGSMFSDDEVKASAKVAIIGETVVKNLFPNGDNPVGKTIRFNSIPFKIIGVLEAKGQNTFGQDQDDIVLAPYTTVQKRILAINYYHSIVASAVSESQAATAVEQIREVIADNHKIAKGEEYDFEVSSQQELIETFSSITEMLTLLLVAIAAISLVVGGIGIMNIMYVSVKERTKEIGLRLAVGGRAKDIMKQFLYESVIISFTGGIIGILFGLSITLAITSIFDWQVIVTPKSMLIAFGVCTVTGIFFGWYPARKASQLDPIQALRYE